MIANKISPTPKKTLLYNMNRIKRFCGFEVTLQPERRQFPSEIVPGFIYLGDASDATRADTLRSLGIRRVVNCAGKCWYIN